MSEDLFFVAGGTLPANASSYITRTADIRLWEGLLAGEFCYVLNTRQMGKSSLVVRAAQALRQANWLVCVLDLSAIGCNLTIEQWYFGMLRRIGVALRLTAELTAFWRETGAQGPLQRWLDAIELVVLPHLARLASESPAGPPLASESPAGPPRLVIFIDEIDVVRSLPFSTDEFFAGIRACYNRRTEEPAYHLLTFCLLGVATPTDLIRDVRTSPFNIGRRILLMDFTQEEALPLAAGFWRTPSGPHDEPQARRLLRRILYWTDGHPYMTQRLCQTVAQTITKTGHPLGVRDVDRICEKLFIAQNEQDSDDNLAFVRNRLLRSDQDTTDQLDLYRQIRWGWRVPDEEANPVCAALRLTGVVKSVRGVFRVRNRIYYRVFNREWVRAHMPDAEVRRQRAAYRRGVLLAGGGASLVVALIGALAMLNFQNARRAQQAEARMRAEADHAHHLLYDANISAAQQRYLAADVTSAQDMLNQSLPGFEDASQDFSKDLSQFPSEYSSYNSSDRPDLRGFEWYYLKRLCDQARRLPPQEDQVTSLARSQDGSLFASGDQSGHILVGQTATWQILTTFHCTHFALAPKDQLLPKDQLSGRPTSQTLHEYNDGISALAFAPDGRHLAVACLNGDIRLYDLVTKREQARLEAHRGNATSVALSPDGGLLASGGNDGNVRLWKIRAGQPPVPLQTLPVPILRGVWSVAFSPDGKWLAAGCDDGQTRLWETRAPYSKQPTRSLRGHSSYVYALAFSPDGKTLLTGSGDGNAILWNLQTGQPAHVLRGHTSYIYAVAFAPDGNRVATGAWDDTIRLWNAQTGAPQTVYGHREPVFKLAFLPDSRTLISCGRDERQVKVWDTLATPGTYRVEMPPGIRAETVTFAAKGTRFAVGRSDGCVEIHDAVDGHLVQSLQGDSAPVRSIAFSTDGQRLIAASAGGNAHLWDLRTGQERQRLPLSTGDLRPNFSEDRHRMRMLLMNAEHRPVLLDADGKLLYTFPDAYRDRMGALSPDGTQVLMCGQKGTVHLLSVADSALGRERHVWQTTQPTCFAFSHDGSLCVIANQQQEATLYDTKSGRAKAVLKGHKNFLRACIFSADDRRVVTATDDGTVRIWDAATGRELLTLTPHSGELSDVAISSHEQIEGQAEGQTNGQPNGQYVITCDRAGNLIVWSPKI